MKKEPTPFQKAIGSFVIAACFYLGDCLVAHGRHQEMPWIESGLYDWGPFGIESTGLAVLVGIIFLVKGFCA
jgi:hypothetical protein